MSEKTYNEVDALSVVERQLESLEQELLEIGRKLSMVRVDLLIQIARKEEGI